MAIRLLLTGNIPSLKITIVVLWDECRIGCMQRDIALGVANSLAHLVEIKVNKGTILKKEHPKGLETEAQRVPG